MKIVSKFSESPKTFFKPSESFKKFSLVSELFQTVQTVQLRIAKIFFKIYQKFYQRFTSSG